MGVDCFQRKSQQSEAMRELQKLIVVALGVLDGRLQLRRHRTAIERRERGSRNLAVATERMVAARDCKLDEAAAAEYTFKPRTPRAKRVVHVAVLELRAAGRLDCSASVQPQWSRDAVARQPPAHCLLHPSDRRRTRTQLAGTLVNARLRCRALGSGSFKTARCCGGRKARVGGHCVLGLDSACGLRAHLMCGVREQCEQRVVPLEHRLLEPDAS